MAPGTEFARDFCAGIGPLQLGVVLVLLLMKCSIHLYSIFEILIIMFHVPCIVRVKGHIIINILVTFDLFKGLSY